jgi:hypothetical protein
MAIPYKCLSGQDLRYQASMVANQIEGQMKKWKHWTEQLSQITADEMTAEGLTADEQAQMGSMRTEVAAFVAAYEANPNSVFIKRHAQLILNL